MEALAHTHNTVNSLANEHETDSLGIVAAAAAAVVVFFFSFFFYSNELLMFWHHTPQRIINMNIKYMGNT